MKGDGRFSLLSGLIFDWRDATTSTGQLGKSGPKPSLYTLNYSGGNKQGDVRVAFAGGAVAQVSMSPTKRPNPRDILVTQDQLRGVLDPMTSAFLRARLNLSEGDLKVCDETIRVFDGQIRFDIALMPKEHKRVESKTPNGYSGLAAVCGVKFVPISGSRPDNPAIKYMSSHTDSIVVWLVPLPRTALYVPYRISLPTAYQARRNYCRSGWTRADREKPRANDDSGFTYQPTNRCYFDDTLKRAQARADDQDRTGPRDRKTEPCSYRGGGRADKTRDRLPQHDEAIQCRGCA